MDKVKIGIIGAGNISRAHIKGYLACDDVTVKAICDCNIERAKEKAQNFGIEQTYSDYKKLLEDTEIDAVSICTWNNSHAQIAIDALAAGKNVLCEKPMAMNTEQALKMEEAADKYGKLLMIGFVRRFGNDCKILKDFIDTGDLGQIYYTKANYIRRYGNPGGWFGDKERSGGGPLIDLGVHVIDLVRYLAGSPQPVSVYGAAFSNIGNRDHIKIPKSYVSADYKKGEVSSVEDMAAAMIRFEGGMVMNLEVSFSLNTEKDFGSIELFGTKSGAKVDPELKMFTEKNGYLIDIIPAHETALSFEGLFEKEIRHFVDCVKGKAECISTAKDGIEVMKIIDAVYKSAETKKEVLI